LCLERVYEGVNDDKPNKHICCDGYSFFSQVEYMFQG